MSEKFSRLVIPSSAAPFPNGYHLAAERMMWEQAARDEALARALLLDVLPRGLGWIVDRPRLLKLWMRFSRVQPVHPGFHQIWCDGKHDPRTSGCPSWFGRSL